MLGKRFLENVDEYSLNCFDNYQSNLDYMYIRTLFAGKKHMCHFFIEINAFIIIIFSLARRAAEPREGKRG